MSGLSLITTMYRIAPQPLYSLAPLPTGLVPLQDRVRRYGREYSPSILGGGLFNTSYGSLWRRAVTSGGAFHDSLGVPGEVTLLHKDAFIALEAAYDA